MQRRICRAVFFVLLGAGIAGATASRAERIAEGAKRPAAPIARTMERIDRGTVAVASDGGVYVGWRFLGTDPDNVAFNVYRGTKKINSAPIVDSTNFMDATGTTDSLYRVVPVIDGAEQQATSDSVPVWPRAYWSIPVTQAPGDENGSYEINDGSVGDLDGDGQYEIVVKRVSKEEGENPLLEGYEFDGTLLWRIDLGPNFHNFVGIPFCVYDLDSDGRAEVVARSAEGTTDGTGAKIGDVDGDGVTEHPLTGDGKYVIDGPEFFSVYDGRTGRELARADYIKREPVEQWGGRDLWQHLHRADAFMIAAAYLDGQKPSFVICRGVWAREKLEAWNWREGRLTRLWRFDSEDWPGYTGQGNHNLSVGDVDRDGKDEIVYGSMTVDDDGKGLYTTRLNHGDAMHLSDMDPDRPGLEVWQCHESGGNGATFRDARTGEIIFQHKIPKDTGRACAADIDPRHRGYECWASTKCPLYNCKGKVIADTPPMSMNFAIWWDGDLLRELLDHKWLGKEVGAGIGKIDKWDYENGQVVNLLTADGTYSCNWTKGTPVLQADLLGDWREEVIWRSDDNREMRVYTTTIPTRHRIYTPMHDPQYRLAVAWQNNIYNQPPHPGFYLGEGMAPPPRPNIEP